MANKILQTASKVLDFFLGKNKKRRKIERTIGWGFMDWADDYFGIIEISNNKFIQRTDFEPNLNKRTVFQSCQKFYGVMHPITYQTFFKKFSMYCKLINIKITLK